jgi:hypothetical protein
MKSRPFFEYLIPFFAIALTACDSPRSREFVLDFSRLPASLPLTLPQSQIESIFDDPIQKSVFLEDFLPEILAQSFFLSFTDRLGHDRGECNETNDTKGATKKIRVARRGEHSEKVLVPVEQKQVRDYSTQKVIALVDVDPQEEKVLSNYEDEETWEVGEGEIFRYPELADNLRCNPKTSLHRLKGNLDRLLGLLIPIRARVISRENQKWTLAHRAEAILRKNKREVRFVTENEGIVSRGLRRSVWFETNRTRHALGPKHDWLQGYSLDMKTTAAHPLSLITTPRTKGVLRNRIYEGQVEASLMFIEEAGRRPMFRWLVLFQDMEWDDGRASSSRCWPSKGALQVRVLPERGFQLDANVDLEFLPDRKISWKDSRGRSGVEQISSSLFLGRCQMSEAPANIVPPASGPRAEKAKAPNL